MVDSQTKKTKQEVGVSSPISDCHLVLRDILEKVNPFFKLDIEVLQM